MIPNFLWGKNIELLNIGDLQLDINLPMSVIDFEKELEVLDEDLKSKPLASVVEEGKFPS